MNVIKQENQDTRKTLMEIKSRNIYSCYGKFITLENDEIKPILNQINNNQTKMSVIIMYCFVVEDGRYNRAMVELLLTSNLHLPQPDVSTMMSLSLMMVN
jgi:hypothetical protein